MFINNCMFDGTIINKIQVFKNNGATYVPKSSKLIITLDILNIDDMQNRAIYHCIAFGAIANRIEKMYLIGDKVICCAKYKQFYDIKRDDPIIKHTYYFMINFLTAYDTSKNIELPFEF